MEHDNEISRHHIMFPKAEHMLRPESRLIRTHPSMIVGLTRPDHDMMHEIVPIVPALGHNTLRAVSRLWTPERDSYRSIDSLCRAIGKVAMHPKSHQIETNLAHLTIEALELEKTVLKEIGYRDGR